MSALRRIKVRGMQVEVWSTSFRIKGMSEVIQVGPNLSDERVEQIIETIYDFIEAKATVAGVDRAVNHVTQVIKRGLR